MSDGWNVPAKNPQGPPETVETTFRTYGGALHKFLMYRLRHRENAEDVAQQVYVRLLQYGETELACYPLAYLFRIAAHAADELLLRQYKGPVTFDSDAAEHGLRHQAQAVPSSVGETAGPAENAEDLKRVLQQLPPMYRAVLKLRKCEGMSYTEIAKYTGLSKHTVKKYMRLALAQSRSSWLELNRTG